MTAEEIINSITEDKVITFSRSDFMSKKELKAEHEKYHPTELGDVKWILAKNVRKVAQYMSQKKNLPILVLFTQMPGSFLAKKLGLEIFKNGKTVKRISRQFIPVAIYTNFDDKHNKEWCGHFKEKS